jgi:hypothetical protein
MNPVIILTGSLKWHRHFNCEIREYLAGWPNVAGAFRKKADRPVDILAHGEEIGASYLV